MEEKYVGGVGKFEYEVLLAWQFPCCDFEDDGEVYEYPHYTCFMNDKDANRVIDKLGLSEQSFYNQDSIIPVVEAYGLDKEKFWYAVVYVAHLTSLWAEQKSFTSLPTALEQLTTMRDEIKDRHEFRVVIDNPLESHSFIMAGNRLVRTLLVQSLNDLIEKERSSNMANAHEIVTWRDQESYKKTEMTWYAANLFKLLFDKMNLPVLRSRSEKKKFRSLPGMVVQVKGRDNMISYDKNQLIAELIHFLGLTDNPNLDGNSIKAILRSERKFGLDIF